MTSEFEPEDVDRIERELHEARSRQDARVINSRGQYLLGEPDGWLSGLLEDAAAVIAALKAATQGEQRDLR